MSEQHVKEAEAVKTLKHGIERYAHQVREASSQARREMADLEHKVVDQVQRRHSELLRAERDLRSAQQALAKCRENCSDLQRQFAQACQHEREARKRYEQSRRAQSVVTQARSDLFHVLQRAESTVAENSSVASSALATLDAKLAELPHLSLGGAARGAVLTIATVARLTTPIPDATHLVGNALAGIGIPNVAANSSLREYADEAAAQLLGKYGDDELERLRQANLRLGTGNQQ